MKLSRSHRKLVCGLAAIGAVVSSIGLVSSVVGALPPGTPPAGAITMTPATGDSSTTFGLSFASAQFCPGDAIAGYLWGTFLTSSTNDPATLTFSQSGNPIAAAGLSTSLRDTTGNPIRNQNPGLTDGVINPPGQLSFSGASFTSVTPGTYWIGIACTKLAGTVINNEKYWATALTITASPGGGPNNFTFGAATVESTTTTSTTTTTTTVAGTTTTTVAGGTTTTVAGATTTTTVAGGAAQAATLSPAVPTAGGTYKVSHPNCRVGETITVTQPQSTPTSVTATCAAAVAGLVRPEQAAAVGTATVTFTAAPTTPGTYTVTSTGTASGTRTATFVIVGVTSTTVTSSGGSPSGTSTGTIPATGSSTTAIIVWGILLLVFGRMAILFGRKPKVISAN